MYIYATNVYIYIHIYIYIYVYISAKCVSRVKFPCDWAAYRQKCVCGSVCVCVHVEICEYV